MIENIIIGQNSLITKYISKYIKNTNIFSANKLDKNDLEKIKEKKKNKFGF